MLEVKPTKDKELFKRRTFYDILFFVYLRYKNIGRLKSIIYFRGKDNQFFAMCRNDDKFHRRISLKIISINPPFPFPRRRKVLKIFVFTSHPSYHVPPFLVAFYFPDFVINGARDLLIIRRATRKSEREGKVWGEKAGWGEERDDVN